MRSKIVEKFIDFLIPKTCINCHLYTNNFLCEVCSKKLRQYLPESFIERKKSNNWNMNSIEKGISFFEKVYYFYYYDQIIHDLVQAIKYDFQKEKIKTLATLFYSSTEFQKVNFNEFDLLTFVPLSKQRQNWRGFNHGKLITKEIAEKFNKPFLQILDKTKNTKSQIDLSREERLKNLQNLFEVKKDLPIEIFSQNILLIDDICSTGSTLIQCAKALKKKFPNVEVYGMALARGEK